MPPFFSRSLRHVALPMTLALLLAACSGPDESQQPPPSPVRYVTMAPVDVTIEEDYAGRVRGSREVEVRSRVEGILLERLYNEGQMVAEGDELFLIDPRPYEIAVRQAEAERANARAVVSQAESEWNRLSGLYERNAVSERDRDQALSNLELARAGLALAEAGLASAELNLSWTQVTAPLSGITGLETVSEGSLISSGALLTSITQTNPVHVRFSLPERDATTQRRARQAMTGSSDQADDAEQVAHLVLPDGSEYAVDGNIDFTAATIDSRTGSVSARAVFPNADGELMPGQFVRIRMVTEELDNVFRVPQQAVTQGPEGPRVFIVDNDNQVRSSNLELGATLGSEQVVLSGLEDGDRIVVSGLNNLNDGMTVDPEPTEAQETAEGGD